MKRSCSVQPSAIRRWMIPNSIPSGTAHRDSTNAFLRKTAMFPQKLTTAGIYTNRMMTPTLGKRVCWRGCLQTGSDTPMQRNTCITLGVIWEESMPMAHAILHDLTDMQLAESRRAASRAWKVLENNGAAEILKTIPNKKKAIAKFNETQAAAYAVYEAAVAYVSLAMKYRGSRNIQAVLNEVPSMVLIQPQDLDKDPFLLNTPNGTYDLTKGLEGAVFHQADHFMTKVTTVDPGIKGKRLWLDALNTFFCGDAELIHYVQLVAGLVAVGQVFIEALIIAYGDGRNGKSTFWNALSRVLGSYSGNISADTLTIGCRRNIKPELAEAKGKRLLIAAELEEGTRFNTSTVKQLCSTDEIYAEKKFKAPFSYVPSHTLVLYTNHLPKVGATDTGIWRRLIVIPFSAKIEGLSDHQKLRRLPVRKRSTCHPGMDPGRRTGGYPAEVQDRPAHLCPKSH